MKFRSDLITGLFVNEQDHIGNTIRSISPREKIIVSQGFGLQDKNLPLRFPAYVVGTIRLLSQLPPSCTVDIYIALGGVLRANNYNVPAMLGRMTLAIEVLKKYIQAVHPEMAHRIRIQPDVWYEPESRLHNFIHSLLPLGEKIIRADSMLAGFVEKRGGIPAIIYMIEHALYMRDPLLGAEEFAGALLHDAVTDMDHVIVIGGPAERVFYHFRQALLQRIGRHTRWQSHQFFLRVGDPPTYHKLSGEPEWGDQTLPNSAIELLQNAAQIKTPDGIATTVLRDLATLLLDCSGTADFKALGVVEKAMKSGSLSPPGVETMLQHGWERLLQLQKC